MIFLKIFCKLPIPWALKAPTFRPPFRLVDVKGHCACAPLPGVVTRMSPALALPGWSVSFLNRVLCHGLHWLLPLAVAVLCWARRQVAPLGARPSAPFTLPNRSEHRSCWKLLVAAFSLINLYPVLPWCSIWLLTRVLVFPRHAPGRPPPRHRPGGKPCMARASCTGLDGEGSRFQPHCTAMSPCLCGWWHSPRSPLGSSWGALGCSRTHQATHEVAWRSNCHAEVFVVPQYGAHA